MGAMKELYTDRQGDMQMLVMLRDLKKKLTEIDDIGDRIRERALRDYASEEPYENAATLGSKIYSALSIVETMMVDLGA
jgi:hypothetical protein